MKIILSNLIYDINELHNNESHCYIYIVIWYQVHILSIQLVTSTLVQIIELCNIHVIFATSAQIHKAPYLLFLKFDLCFMLEQGRWSKQ